MTFNKAKKKNPTNKATPVCLQQKVHEKERMGWKENDELNPQVWPASMAQRGPFSHTTNKPA